MHSTSFASVISKAGGERNTRKISDKRATKHLLKADAGGGGGGTFGGGREVMY